MRRAGPLYFFIFGTFMVCLFSFKYFLVSVGDAGIRVDDLLIGAAAILLLTTGNVGRVTLPGAARTYLLFAGWCIFSALYNGFLGRIDALAGILFSVRLLEYMVFLYIGAFLASRGANLGRALSTYLVVVCILVSLQFVDIVPVFGGFDADRASGNTNGPYELAVVAAFLCLYFVESSNLAWSGRLKAIASYALLLATASRVTNVALILVFVRTMKSGFAKIGVIAGAGIAIGITAISGLPTGGDTTFAGRITLVDFGQIGRVIADVYPSIPVSETSQEFLASVYDDPLNDLSALSIDASAYVRFYRWIALAKSTFASLETAVIGLGPSFSSLAVDGYFVRVMAETGLIGLSLFVFFLVQCFRWAVGKPVISGYLSVLTLTALFIDIFTSYKAMLLFWLMVGWFSTKRVADASRSRTQGLKRDLG